MLHGWGQSKSDLLPLGELLSTVARVTVVDLPGFGESPRPEEVWGTGDYAECLINFLDSRNIESSILFGHSFGGRVALRCAGLHPQRVQSLVLMSAAGLPRRRSLKANLRLASIRLLRSVIRWTEPWFGPGMRTWFVDRFGSRDYKAAGEMRAILVKTVNEDLTETAKQVRCPSLLLWGELDDETPLEIAVRYSRLLVDSRLVAMPRKDHFPYQGVGAHLCAYYILGWLRSQEVCTSG
jgi:pimeloyl-ACP methyl ester carboxylesterase